MQTPIETRHQSVAQQAAAHLMAGNLPSDEGQESSDEIFYAAAADAPLVLVADDSLTERANLSRIIQAAGYSVVTASSGNEAIELAVKYQPIAVFLDIIMDDGDGYKACRGIKRNTTTAGIPVIMVSSKTNAVDQKWAEKLGADSYVVKPYADSDILQRLESIWQVN